MRLSYPLVLLLAFTVMPAHAQWDNFAAQTAMTTLHASVLERSIERNEAKTSSSFNQSKQTAASQSLRIKKLDFLPSLVQRRANLSKFADQLNIENLSDIETVRTAFSTGDVIAQAGVAVKPLGLRVDNVADAYTIWWVTAWKGVNGDYTLPDRAQFQAVKAQVTSAMIGNAQLMQATSEQKQELAEALIVQSILIEGTTELVKDNPKALRDLQAGIRKGAVAAGSNLDDVILTPMGFTPAG